MTTTTTQTNPVAAARDALDAHVRETIAWHFSQDTGTPYWIQYAKQHRIDPASIQTFDDLITTFDHFDADQVLRFVPHDMLIPKHLRGRPYNVFETGGTTGMPKQRLNWEDYQYDYTQFSKTLRDEHFPRGGTPGIQGNPASQGTPASPSNWLMIGPTGPRRLRLAIEHLAHCRGSSVYFVDLDPRWVKRVIREGNPAQAKAYMAHAIDQAMTILRHRQVSALFTTPKLLEALSERMSLVKLGIKGAFVGGTTMDPQYTRFLIEEVCEQPDGNSMGTAGVGFYPTYGNTLMGVAPHRPNIKENNWATTYYCPQPRAVLRVVNPDDTLQTVGYGQFGRVELTTLTKELFMPRFLERDEAKRVEPWLEKYPWDGVSQVRPFGASTSKIVEGVY